MGKRKAPNKDHKFCPCCGGLTERYLTVNEVAELTSTSPDTWRKYIRERSIEYVKIQGNTRIPYSSLKSIIEVVPVINTITIDRIESI
jgi:excisionase family DNA binding protein